MSKATEIIENVRNSVSEHSPDILTGLGIAGVVATTALAVKGTTKAVRIVDELREELNDEPTAKEVVQATWKCYISTAISGVTSIACIAGANSVNSTRSAAIATVCKLTESAFAEYKDSVIEVVGEKKEKDIRDNIAKKRLENDPVTTKEVIITGTGTTLCYDSISGRYFESDIETIRRAENEFNRMLLRDDSLSLNDFYDLIGLDPTKVEGDTLGWRVDWGFIDISFSSHIAKDGRPCIVLNYGNAPRYGYDKAY